MTRQNVTLLVDILSNSGIGFNSLRLCSPTPEWQSLP